MLPTVNSIVCFIFNHESRRYQTSSEWWRYEAKSLFLDIFTFFKFNPLNFLFTPNMFRHMCQCDKQLLNICSAPASLSDPLYVVSVRPHALVVPARFFCYFCNSYYSSKVLFIHCCIDKMNRSLLWCSEQRQRKHVSRLTAALAWHTSLLIVLKYVFVTISNQNN